MLIFFRNMFMFFKNVFMFFSRMRFALRYRYIQMFFF